MDAMGRPDPSPDDLGRSAIDAAWCRADVDRARLDALLGTVEAVQAYLRDVAIRATDPDIQKRIRQAIARLDDARRIVGGR